MDAKKARGLLKLRLNAVMQPFNIYGLGVFIPDAIAEIVKLAEQFHKDMKEV